MTKRVLIAGLAIASAITVYVVAWMRNRRLGAGVVNALVDPIIVGRGLAGGAHSEIGILHHVGRVSGKEYRTPVRPVPTPEGFRIVVPLATESQWARNVLAAGHCALEWRETVYELDEPRLVKPSECPDLIRPIRLLSSALGFGYMRLHRFEGLGSESIDQIAPPEDSATPETVPTPA